MIIGGPWIFQLAVPPGPGHILLAATPAEHDRPVGLDRLDDQGAPGIVIQAVVWRQLTPPCTDQPSAVIGVCCEQAEAEYNGAHRNFIQIESRARDGLLEVKPWRAA